MDAKNGDVWRFKIGKTTYSAQYRDGKFNGYWDAKGNKYKNVANDPVAQGENSQSGAGSGPSIVGLILSASGEPWIHKNSSFARAIFPRSAQVMGAQPMTSVSSLVSRRVATSVGSKVGGRVVSRAIPVVGQALLIYDGLDFMWTYRKELGTGVQEYQRYRDEGLIPPR